LIGRTASQFAGDLLAGNAYVNIHNSVFPAGEIRGQLACSQGVTSSIPQFPLGLSILFAVLVPALLLLENMHMRKPAVSI